MSVEVLLVEDDPILGKSLHQMLSLEGFVVNWAQRYSDAINTINSNRFKCFVFDIGLPDGSGLEICHHVRLNDSETPILFLTAQTDEVTLLKAFDLGANDFLKKPFSQKELIARIKALTRNVSDTGAIIVLGEYKLDTEKRILIHKDKQQAFNNTEMQILKLFFANADKVVTRDRLLRFLGKENEVFDRTIDSHISHIRRSLKDQKFENIQLKSVYGLGYKLEIETL